MREELVSLKAPDFGKIMSPKVLQSASDLQKERLVEFLPENQKSKDFLMRNFHSPQFQQALEALDEAVYSYDCANIFRSFDIYDEEIFKTARNR